MKFKPKRELARPKNRLCIERERGRRIRLLPLGFEGFAPPVPDTPISQSALLLKRLPNSFRAEWAQSLSKLHHRRSLCRPHAEVLSV